MTPRLPFVDPDALLTPCRVPAPGGSGLPSAGRSPTEEEPDAHRARRPDGDGARDHGRETLRAAVVVGALGVVFGDIGTSPIYTLQTVFNPADPHPVPVSTDNVFGVVSLIFWSVMIIVTVTYVLLAMRADNDGEGGIMALITLLRRWGARQAAGARRVVLAALGIFGASLFFGDSMITPAISVLSAVEGAQGRRARRWTSCVVPITAVIIVAAVPRPAPGHRGGRPGVRPGHDRLVRGHRRAAASPASPTHPEILKALSPDLRARLPGRPLRHRVLRAGRDRARGHRRRGAVRRHGPLRPPGDHPRLAVAWCFPACMLSYLGQGALILEDPANISSPFFLLAPELGPAAAGPAGHRGDRDRLPGRDHRRVLGRRRRPPSSATCRGCGSRTPRSRRSARSTCRGSTGC